MRLFMSINLTNREKKSLELDKRLKLKISRYTHKIIFEKEKKRKEKEVWIAFAKNTVVFFFALYFLLPLPLTVPTPCFSRLPSPNHLSQD